ncbi:hypothetical protein [Acinetobacter boissieri]|uniref:Uncharacterized protein n=1 Tax=Acinetobacter boissieri TaxID=1219383 RepID=A0A1G6GRX3_9GAMM|nr:hypothetical protein [Acinetobacter boissieri]SDB84603.1 hypothetical protein SAMN05421733_10281 [Acinetobacter boissieri]
MQIKYRCMISVMSLAMLASCSNEKYVKNITTSNLAPKTTCTWDTSVPLSYEERRLETPLPYSGINVVGNNSAPLATRIINGTGFEDFTPAFKASLCAEDGTTTLSNFKQAMETVNRSGEQLWRAAVDRAQNKRVRKPSETLPSSEDRMLYWTRVQMTKALRQWNPHFALTLKQKEQLQWAFEKSSRGQNDINLPKGTTANGKVYRRMIISGFDVFTLGTPGEVNMGLRNGNPTGAIALALDGKEFTLSDGSILHIESYILPVSYDPFRKGMQEDTLGPWFKKGPQRVDASITMSQGASNIFWLEQYNGRYHGTYPGNDGMIYCQSNSLPKDVLAVGTQISVDAEPITHIGSGCNIVVQEDWYRSNTSSQWIKDSPPQFTKASLPYKKILESQTQRGIVRPIGATSEGTEGFDVTWHTNYTYFPDCSVYSTINQAWHGVVNKMPDLSTVKDPDPTWCARRGGGGDYLSNESGYRNTLLRDVMGLNIPAGHVHVPVMNYYYDGTVINGGGTRDDNSITDTRYESYRTAIIGQSINLLKVIGESLIQ